MRRALTGGTLAIVVISIAAILAVLLHLLGWVGPWSWTSWTVVLASSLVGAAGLGAAFAPVREAPLAREIDRRLKLGGALVTALEVEGSPDPICRLLVHRTAAMLMSIPLRQAVPLRLPVVALVLPALLTMAIGLRASVRPVDSPTRFVDQSMNPADRELSRDLQEVASMMLSSQGPVTEEIVQAARRLLEIEAALRRGDLDPGQVRASLVELAGSLDRRSREEIKRNPTHAPEPPAGHRLVPVAPGVPHAEWSDALEALARGDSAATSGSVPGIASAAFGSPEGRSNLRGDGSSGTSQRGSGRGAGVDAADLMMAETEPPWREVARTSGRSSWILPRPSRLTETEGSAVTGPPGEESSSWPAGKRQSSRLVLPARPFTAEEQRLVEAFFRVLHRAEGGVATGERADAQGSREEEGR